MQLFLQITLDRNVIFQAYALSTKHETTQNSLKASQHWPLKAGIIFR